ncbi:hypothetical protein LTR28_008342, partial [Elasticomyces elasticus]
MSGGYGVGERGSSIVATLISHSSISSLTAYSRRELPTNSTKLKALISKDQDSWPSTFPSNANLFFSALGTTRAAAGSLQNQRKIDYDLNLALARAAKENGVSIYVLVSTAGASHKSMFGYTKMKGELEEA